MRPTRGPRLEVLGLDGTGTVVVRADVRHGQDPEQLLAAHGWSPVGLLEVDGDPDRLLRFSYRVRAPGDDEGSACPSAGAAEVAHDPDLVLAPGEDPVPRQRVAAYAVVESDRGLLLTQFSALTNVAGRWGLPGGGLDPGERPAAAAVREVWEETGQEIAIAGLVGVQTQHWIGRAPDGRVEDYHAVRVIHRGHCARPTEPVVHDLGGTTERAAWVPLGELTSLDATGGTVSLLRAVGLL